MKKMTLWQRLNIALVMMILLLVGGFFVVTWTQEARSEAKRHIAELTTAKAGGAAQFDRNRGRGSRLFTRSQKRV